MIAIRLRRMGTKNRLKWKIVVADSRISRDSRLLEELGSYNPRVSPSEVRLRMDRYEAWIRRGARPSRTVAAIARRERKSGAPH